MISPMISPNFGYSSPFPKIKIYPRQDALRFRSLPDRDPLALAACADKPGQRIRRTEVKADGTRLGSQRGGLRPR